MNIKQVSSTLVAQQSPRNQ